MPSKDDLLRPLKRHYVRRFRAYDEDRLIAGLRHLGVGEGDTLMVHASWHPNNGFSGSPAAFVAALKSALGPSGLLAMTSLPYHDESSAAYLQRGKPMDVRRTPSRMGLLTEVFRRDPETRRSLSPTHPVLARGRDAEAFIAGHDKTRVPFGPDSPFARLADRDAKILLVDTSFGSITFTHYLEDRLAEKLGFPLYEPEPREAVVIDAAGQEIHVPTLVISAAANAARREERLIQELEARGDIAGLRVGNTGLERIACRAMLDCADRMITEGRSFFDPIAR